MTDISPQLYEQVKKAFDEKVKNDRSLKLFLDAMNKESVTGFKEVYDYSETIGKYLARAFQEVLSSDVLPDGRMYYNIAKSVVEPFLQNNYSAAVEAAAKTQEILNKKAGIGINAIKPAVNQDKINGIINRVSSEKDFDSIKWILGEPVVNLTQSGVDDTIQKNVEFHGRSGMTPKVTRITTRKCCEWCENLAGEYAYPSVPKDVYHRHENCRCIVEYNPGDGKRQNVWNKQWADASVEARNRRIELSQAEQGQVSGVIRQRAIEAAQNGDDATIPQFMKGDFSDYEPLTLPQSDIDILNQLHSISVEENVEYAQIIYNGGQTDLFTDNKHGMIHIPVNEIQGNGLRVYHTHTNDTPLSYKDFTILLNEKVESIGVITNNGDVFAVRIDSGERPSVKEFEAYVEDLKKQVDCDIMQSPHFFEVSPAERKYMACREQFYQTIMHYGWIAEGGRIDE